MSTGPIGFPVDALTLEKIMAKGVDTVNTRSPLLTQVLSNAEDFNGRQLNWHVVIAQNNTISSYTGFDPLNVNPQQPLTQATVYFTNVQASIALADDQIAINATDAGRVDYVKSMSENAFNSLGANIGLQLYSDGASNISGPKDLVGIQAAINNVTGDNLTVFGAVSAVTRAGFPVYAGISRATFPTWSSVVRSTGAVPITLPMVYTMKALIEKNSRGVRADTIVVGPVTWTYFAGLTTPVQREILQPSEKNPMLSIGAQAIMIAGLTVISDVLCPEGIAYFLVKDDIKFASITPANAKSINYSITTTEDNNFDENPVKAFWRSEPVRPVNQMATVFHVGITGNFIVKKPSNHGVLTNIIG